MCPAIATLNIPTAYFIEISVNSVHGKNDSTTLKNTALHRVHVHVYLLIYNGKDILFAFK